MNRRHLLAGLALASVRARTQTRTPEAAGESLYIPKPQLIEDRRFLHDFMEEFAFVDLVTVSPSLRSPRERGDWAAKTFYRSHESSAICSTPTRCGGRCAMAVGCAMARYGPRSGWPLVSGGRWRCWWSMVRLVDRGPGDLSPPSDGSRRREGRAGRWPRPRANRPPREFD